MIEKLQRIYADETQDSQGLDHPMLFVAHASLPREHILSLATQILLSLSKKYPDLQVIITTEQDLAPTGKLILGKTIFTKTDIFKYDNSGNLPLLVTKDREALSGKPLMDHIFTVCMNI